METELVADYHGGTEVKLVAALGFYIMFGCLESQFYRMSRDNSENGVK